MYGIFTSLMALVPMILMSSTTVLNTSQLVLILASYSLITSSILLSGLDGDEKDD